MLLRVIEGIWPAITHWQMSENVFTGGNKATLPAFGNFIEAWAWYRCGVEGLDNDLGRQARY